MTEQINDQEDFKSMGNIRAIKIFSLFCVVFAFCPLITGQVETHTAALSSGWDVFSEPLSKGIVQWTVLDNRNLQVSFELNGASPNHRYITGAHFFDPGGSGQLPGVCQFGGSKITCDRGPLTREGMTATVLGSWDFGYLDTNGNGYGKAQFILTPPPGIYYAQFTVRIGDQCDLSSGATNGCPVAYRTGTKLGQGFETVNIPIASNLGQSLNLEGSSSYQLHSWNRSVKVETHTAALSPGWDVSSEQLSKGMVQWAVLNNRNLQVSFELNGASPNHRYIAGAHFFDPGGSGQLPGVCQFGGSKISCDRGPLTREGMTATVLGSWDFGYLDTNVTGYARAPFILTPPPGIYYVQFTVRIGDQCDLSIGATNGCPVAYRTGTKLGQGFETVKIPSIY